VRTVRKRRTRRAWAQVGAPDESLIRFSGLAAVTELTGRLGIIDKLDDAVGPIKDRDRGFSAGQVLVGMAAAQLCGEDFLVGLDRHRADRAGQALTPVAGLASTTAAGLARRLVEGQWAAVGSGQRWRPGSVGCMPPRSICSPRPRRAGRRSCAAR